MNDSGISANFSGPLKTGIHWRAAAYFTLGMTAFDNFGVEMK
jgi:hypothetical protein